MTRILVLGQGFIGKPLAQYLGADICTKRLHTITKEDLNSYDVVINCAAKATIDWCEKNKMDTFDTNVVQAVRIAKMVTGKYVFFSSACIFGTFNGEVNYEDSKPAPQCFYTYTKLMAEQLLMEVKPDTLIIRPRFLVSPVPHPRNVLDKLLSYSKIVDTQESITVLEDLFPKVKELLGESGAFNVVNEGTMSPSEIMNLMGHKHEIITKAELDEMTKDGARRVSTVLGSKRTALMPNIRERMNEIIAKRK
jgi:dTDP-4-dehydrorhamnose reductase